MPIWWRLFWHVLFWAISRTFWTAGMSRPIRIAMMAITTSNSTSVKPLGDGPRERFMMLSLNDGNGAVSGGTPCGPLRRGSLQFEVERGAVLFGVGQAGLVPVAVPGVDFLEQFAVGLAQVGG